MLYTVVLIPAGDSVAVAVPALPGCTSQGRSREEALANVRDAIEGWILTEREQGREPLFETPQLVSAGVAEALEIIDDMRDAGELPGDYGYELELVPVRLAEPTVA
jgi:predicted RNase H-like HicB family nuclease